MLTAAGSSMTILVPEWFTVVVLTDWPSKAPPISKRSVPLKFKLPLSVVAPAKVILKKFGVVVLTIEDTPLSRTVLADGTKTPVA